MQTQPTTTVAGAAAPEGSSIIGMSPGLPVPSNYIAPADNAVKSPKSEQETPASIQSVGANTQTQTTSQINFTGAGAGDYTPISSVTRMFPSQPTVNFTPGKFTPDLTRVSLPRVPLYILGKISIFFISLIDSRSVEEEYSREFSRKIEEVYARYSEECASQLNPLPIYASSNHFRRLSSDVEHSWYADHASGVSNGPSRGHSDTHRADQRNPGTAERAESGLQSDRYQRASASCCDDADLTARNAAYHGQRLSSAKHLLLPVCSSTSIGRHQHYYRRSRRHRHSHHLHRSSDTTVDVGVAVTSAYSKLIDESVAINVTFHIDRAYFRMRQ